VARPRQFDEDKILAAVRDQFWRQGYAATSLDDLMRVTGLGKGSIYGAFGDKRNLFLAVLRVYADERVAHAREALHSEKSAIERLRALFRMSDKRKRSPAPCPGCFLFNSTTELALHDAEVREISKRVYGAIEQLLIETAEQAKKDGDLPTEFDASELGRLLLAVTQGLTFLEKTGIDSRDLLSIMDGARHLLLDEKSDEPAHQPDPKKRSRALRKQHTQPVRTFRRRAYRRNRRRTITATRKT
jgi:TetR/AcrR family transcriptional regulator, transcriptional repressor for nem operon